MRLTIDVTEVPIFKLTFTNLAVIMGSFWGSVRVVDWSGFVEVEKLIVFYFGKFLFFHGGVSFEIFLK